MQKKNLLPLKREVALIGCFRLKNPQGIGMPMRKALLMRNEIFRVLPLARNPAKRKPSTSLCVTVTTKSPFRQPGAKLDLAELGS